MVAVCNSYQRWEVLKVETLHRFEAESRTTTVWMLRLENRVKELKEENKSRGEDRKEFHKTVLEVLVQGDGRTRRGMKASMDEKTDDNTFSFGRSTEVGREMKLKLGDQWILSLEQRRSVSSVIRDGTLASTKKVMDERYIKTSTVGKRSSNYIEHTIDLP
ncbi:hypothetical protein TorRG33x02_075420 [Trema orientale]|uniref:Uncharacterized protein n=1 Tax=Trema orientale TaxID=63057 RepID=A0A2P5FFK5_TREOI|nr:hypothetical protein TorRG33x02_075420 [Trema orientale]